MAELLTPEQIRYQTEHWHESKSEGLRLAASILISFATIAVVLRLWARKLKLLKHRESIYGADDYMIVVALLFAWGLFGLLVYSMIPLQAYHNLHLTAA